MAVIYIYAYTEYSTEADAQAAATSLSTRMQNNPTDWMEAKEITGSSDAGWQMNPEKLTDAKLLNPDASKMYMAYSKDAGTNIMPLTASELATKRNEFRVVHGQALDVNVIYKIDDSTDPSTVTTITPTTDMSGYV
jgi:hypothetical protein